MPFTTIENIVHDRKNVGIINEHNYPFSVGRNFGVGEPDDSEFVVITLDTPLGLNRRK